MNGATINKNIEHDGIPLPLCFDVDGVFHQWILVMENGDMLEPSTPPMVRQLGMLWKQVTV